MLRWWVQGGNNDGAQWSRWAGEAGGARTRIMGLGAGTGCQGTWVVGREFEGT